MLLFFYHLLWTLGFIFLLPAFLIASKGRVLRRFRHEPGPMGFAGRTIWVHALSVGEVISAIPLVEALVSQGRQENVLFTATTDQGLVVARKELGSRVKWLSGMPFDAWWLVRALVASFNPSVFVLVETDIWPGLLYHLKKKGTGIILVNGRVSPRTFRRYKRFRYIVDFLFAPFDLCLVQSDLDRDRLVYAGVDPGKVKVTGNIKFDRSQPRMTETGIISQRNTLALAPGDAVFVAGSIHAGEEVTILETFRRLRSDFPGLRLILAPRRIDQAGTILDRARKMGFTSVRRTDLHPKGTNYDVLILDTIGELAGVYRVGTVAFVGGSLVPEGGHNLLEPAAHGCPVLFGPHTFNFTSMADALALCGGGRRVGDGEALQEVVRNLLSSPEERDRMGRHARRFVEENRGALARVISAIKKCADDPGSEALHEDRTDQISYTGP
jgi:3-deoxy-D-manno-octulosonic-acid transferase